MTDEPNVPMNDGPADTPTAPTPPVEPTAGYPQTPPTWGSTAQGWPAPPAEPVTPPHLTEPPPPAPPQYGAPQYGAPQYGTPQYGSPEYAQPQYGQPQYGQPASTQPQYGQAQYGQPQAQAQYDQPHYGHGQPQYGQYPQPGYGQQAPGWGPPAGSSGPSTAARRVLAAIAVAVLIIASAGVGAAVSEAVHSNSDNSTAATAPNFGNGSTNNGGLGNGLGNGTGNGLGNGLGNGNGNGSSSGSANSQPSPQIVSKVDPAVVNIFTTIDNGNGQGEAAGTGMVISSEGEVLTNNHVIDGAQSIRVQIVDTGETHTARVLGYNVVDDIALIKIDDVANLKTVSFADASKVNVGDPVVAIGNAGGRGGTPTATSGSVTALDQKVTAGDIGSAKSETLHGMIQISAPIEPGDSGGPLVDANGEVIGMNTAAAQNDQFFGQTGSSVAFAIPIDKALQVVRQIQSGTDTDTVHVGERGILGVQVQNVPSGTSPAGAFVAGVQAGSPAADAGINEGDVITSIEGKSVASASDLTAVMFPYHPDDKVELSWSDSSGQSHSGTATLVVGPPD